MILGNNVGSVYNEGRDIQKVYSHGKLVWEKQIEDIDYSTIPFTVKAIDNDVEISAKASDGSLIVLKYLINDGAYQYGETINIKRNDRVIIKIELDYGIRFSIKGLSDIYGNIMSLMYGDYFANKTFWKFLFQDGYGLFQNCDIRHAKNLILPSSTMQPYGCWGMFYKCKNLLSAPELPATTLATRCYSAMFYGCSKLRKAPELPATSLKVGCYQAMFYGCSSLTTTPKLPAKYLADECYLGMFIECYSLTTSPELPATTLAEGCYDGMFRYCNKLNYIKCYAKYNLKYISSKWTEGVSPTGILVCEEEAASTLKSTIPEGWSIEYIT